MNRWTHRVSTRLLARQTTAVATSLGKAHPTSSPGLAAADLRSAAVPGVLNAAGPPGDRSANGALSSGSGALADASRRTSGGGDGLCLVGGHRPELI